MSTREARLATVLRVRRVQEDQRRADLARAVEAQAHLERAVAAAEAYLASRFHAVPPGPAPVVDFLAARQVMAGGAHRLSAAVAEHGFAEGETERARALLVEARVRTSGLERLVERARDVRRSVLAAADRTIAEESVRARQVQA